jgi:hypothetical protein
VRLFGRGEKSVRHPSEMAGTSGEKGGRPGVGDAARASAVIRATDIILTHGGYRIEPGWACQAKLERGAASEMSPQPGAAPSPAQSGRARTGGSATPTSRAPQHQRSFDQNRAENTFLTPRNNPRPRYCNGHIG